MKTMYIDCGMGAAGDMLTAALLELLPEDERADFIAEFNALGIPGVEMSTAPSVKCGITGTHVTIRINGKEETEEMYDQPPVHEHSHGHGGAAHSHNGVAGIRHIVEDHLDLPAKVREDVLAVYDLIADAESKAHGAPVAEIHFHEVGTMDAVADVTAVCMLMDRIGAEQVIISPINTGRGTAKCAHGILPVPAPSTANILLGMPTYSNDMTGELCTPTGAALLRRFATGFGPQPVMITQAIGYGMGTKDYPVANCVRVMLGESF